MEKWRHKNFNNFFKFFAFESFEQKMGFLQEVIQIPHGADISLDINPVEDKKVKVKIKSVYDSKSAYQRIANKIDEAYWMSC